MKKCTLTIYTTTTTLMNSHTSLDPTFPEEFMSDVLHFCTDYSWTPTALKSLNCTSLELSSELGRFAPRRWKCGLSTTATATATWGCTFFSHQISFYLDCLCGHDCALWAPQMEFLSELSSDTWSSELSARWSVSQIISCYILHMLLLVDVNGNCNVCSLTRSNSLSSIVVVFQHNKILSVLHTNWKHRAGVVWVWQGTLPLWCRGASHHLLVIRFTHIKTEFIWQ